MKTAKAITEMTARDVARFWSQIDKSGPCWLFKGYKNKRGYGVFSLMLGRGKSRTVLAHRVAAFLAGGPLPSAVLVLHDICCTSKACVRHLHRGDQKQNMAEARIVHGNWNVGPKPEQQWLRKYKRRVVRRPDGTIVGLARDTKEVRAQIVDRSLGACEACGVQLGADGQMDHFKGRAKEHQDVTNCWYLCAPCHHQKTRNHPTRRHWLERFATHAAKHGYNAQVIAAYDRMAFDAAQGKGQ